MKRKLLTALIIAGAMVMSTAAVADHKIGGYYRVQGYFEDLSFTKDGNDTPAKYVTQRLRAKWTNTLNDFVSIVWYGEADTDFGSAGKGPGGGGQVGADGVLIETKHAYMNLKIPNSAFSVRTGIQGFGDNWNDVLVDQDMAGVTVNAAFGGVALTGGWFKLNENDSGPEMEDDRDLWGLKAAFSPADSLKVMVDGYYVNDNQTGSNSDTYTVGAKVAQKLDALSWNAWLAYQFGEAGDTDIAALAGNAELSLMVGEIPLDFGLIFYGADDDDEDDNSFNEISGSFQYYKYGLNVFLADIYQNNGSGPRTAIVDAGEAGYGLLGLTARTKFNFGATYLKLAAGYFMALQDDRNDGEDEVEGESLGLELAAQYGIKVAEKADISLRGSYVALGDFYEDSDDGEDPDNLYKLVLMVNVGY